MGNKYLYLQTNRKIEMSTDMDDNQGGGVGAFAEEEANKKRLKKLESRKQIDQAVD